jgi:hypothetical protein
MAPAGDNDLLGAARKHLLDAGPIEGWVKRTVLQCQCRQCDAGREVSLHSMAEYRAIGPDEGPVSLLGNALEEGEFLARCWFRTAGAAQDGQWTSVQFCLDGRKLPASVVYR